MVGRRNTWFALVAQRKSASENLRSDRQSLLGRGVARAVSEPDDDEFE
jgi:hypothetical protein